MELTTIDFVLFGIMAVTMIWETVSVWRFCHPTD